jgi:hypothetical protein
VGRVLIVLIAACLVATFFIINNSSFKFATTTASLKPEEAKSKPEKDRPAKRERESSSRVSKKTTSSRSPHTNSVTSSEVKSAAGVADDLEIVQDPEHATVKGDYTPVYSVNSKDSSIVKVLNKGDRVFTDLVVIDVQGTWTIVKKNDLSKPGFVEREDLQPANATKKKDAKR